MTEPSHPQPAAGAARLDGIDEAVHQVVADMAPNRAARVTEASRFIDDLGFDSFALLELVVALETRFTLPALVDAEAGDVATVGDLARMVRRQLAASSAEDRS